MLSNDVVVCTSCNGEGSSPYEKDCTCSKCGGTGEEKSLLESIYEEIVKCENKIKVSNNGVSEVILSSKIEAFEWVLGVMNNN